jgi:hypothetical protein
MKTIWLALLLTALAWILKWLLTMDRPLEDEELAKINLALWRARELEAAAVLRGATPGGVPEDK